MEIAKSFVFFCFAVLCLSGFLLFFGSLRSLSFVVGDKEETQGRRERGKWRETEG